MRWQIVVPAVEQIFQMQPGFGLAFDTEASLKEQRIGIDSASRKIDEVHECTSNRDMRRLHRMAQPTRAQFERERERHVIDAQCDAFAGQFAEPLRDDLAAQQLIDRECEQLRLRGDRRQTQRVSKYGMSIEHGHVPGGCCTHSCHARRVCVLTFVKLSTARGASG
jgi:predicted TPR repeat methyltransferase